MDPRQVDTRLGPMSLTEPLASLGAIGRAGGRSRPPILFAIEQATAPRRLEPAQEP
jgi:hypothetical protein